MTRAGPTNDPPVASGRLRTEVAFHLQTVRAGQFVLGRARSARAHRVIGLRGFAWWTSVIVAAARADDPFADWWLLRLETAAAALRCELETWCAQMRTACAAAEAAGGVSIVTASSPGRPWKLTVTHAYAVRA